MPKVASGYVRSIPGGSPVPNIDVTVRHEGSGLPVAVGGMSASSQNPMVTDSTGFFSWSCELSPGPIRVEAVIDASETKVRSGKEMMQAGDLFISEVPQILNLFTPGVVRDPGGSPFVVEAVIGSLAVRVLPGAANMRGRYLQTLSNRELTIAPNTTINTRRDYVVLEQTMSGTETGKQVIRVLTGTVDNTLPALNTNSSLYQVRLYYVTISLNASSVTVTDVRIYAGPPIADGSITGAMLADNSVDSSKIVDGSVGYVELAIASVYASRIADGQVILSKLASNSVDSSKIVDGSVALADLAANSVDSSKIVDLSVGTAELADSAVTNAKIGSSAVTSSKLGSGSVGSSALATSSVTPEKLSKQYSQAPTVFVGNIPTATLGIHSDSPTLVSISTPTVNGQLYLWQVFGHLFGEGSGNIAQGVLRIYEGANLKRSTIASMEMDIDSSRNLNYTEVIMGTGLNFLWELRYARTTGSLNVREGYLEVVRTPIG